MSGYLQRENIRAFKPEGRHLVTLVLRKLLASSPTAIEGALNRIVTRIEAQGVANEDELADDFETADEVADEMGEDADGGEAPRVTAEELDELRSYRALAAGVRRNSKAEALLKVLPRAFDRIEELGGQRKTVIFTESVRTQMALRDLLAANGYDGRIVLMNGSNNDPESKRRYKEWVERHKGTSNVSGSKTADTKAAIVEAFREDADILIATEAGGEGVNLQFCSLLINYDLPWNPQRVEQRIGRVHRYGQKCDVVVVNFINRANKADERVFELLEEKFALFDGVFGASDEILGALESGVDIEKRILAIYQQCRTTEEVETAFDALQAEMADLLEEKDADARAKLIEHFDEDVAARLKGRREAANDSVGTHQRRLLALVQGEQPDAVIEGSRFELDGRAYALDWKEAERTGARFFRLGTPEADAMVEAAKARATPPARLAFDLDAYAGRIADAEALRGRSGVLVAGILSMKSLKEREELVLVMRDADGGVVDEETVRRLLLVPAGVEPPDLAHDMPALDDAIEAAMAERRERASKEDEGFYEEEMSKLEAWAEEAKAAGELEIEALGREIRDKKSERRRAAGLNDRVTLDREIKALEKRRKDRRMSLYDEQDRIEDEKDTLIDRVQEMLALGTEWRPLMTVEWSVA